MFIGWYNKHINTNIARETIPNICFKAFTFKVALLVNTSRPGFMTRPIGTFIDIFASVNIQTHSLVIRSIPTNGTFFQRPLVSITSNVYYVRWFFCDFTIGITWSQIVRLFSDWVTVWFRCSRLFYGSWNTIIIGILISWQISKQWIVCVIRIVLICILNIDFIGPFWVLYGTSLAGLLF